MFTTQPEHLTIDRFETPIGTAQLVTDADGFLRSFDWTDYAVRQQKLIRRYNGETVQTPGKTPPQFAMH